jgi:hypothetical protein
MELLEQGERPYHKSRQTDKSRGEFMAAKNILDCRPGKG